MTEDWLTPLLHGLSARGAELLAPRGELPPRIDAQLACFWRATSGTKGMVPNLRTRRPRRRRRLAAWLSSPADAITATAQWRETGWLPDDMPDFITIASDFGGNSAFVFLGGELAGMVGVLDHEDVTPVPAFVDVRGFLAALMRSDGIDLVDLVEKEAELPRRARPEDAVAVAERALFAARRDRFLHGGTSLDAFTAMQFLPFGEAGMLKPFLDCEDMWIRAHACSLVGRLRLVAGIPWLVDLAVRGPEPNVPIACLAALREWGAAEADTAIEALRPHLGDRYAGYFP